jgi:uncharacterized membrane protein (UPF0182 family)
MPGHLSVADAAAALGTSPQTVRTLLRTGELRGEKRAWGSRFVWEVSGDSVEEFLEAYGRLDGRRRSAARAAVPVEEPGGDTTDLPTTTPDEEPSASPVDGGADTRRFFLRPRGRALVIVLVLLPPLLVAYAWARFMPSAWWFDELGQSELFGQLVAAQVRLYLLAGALAAGLVAGNLALATRGGADERRWPRRAGVLGAALVVGSLFGSLARDQWQPYVLWRHRQAFGSVDPASGKDVGYFVFSLPWELEVWQWLLSLFAVTALLVAGVALFRGSLRLRPWHADLATQIHLCSLGGLLLLLVAWRVHLQRFLLSLDQPTPGDSHTFAGIGYVDAHVRLPVLTGLSVLVALLAVACVAAPFLSGAVAARRRTSVAVAGAIVVAVPLALVVAPALVQRYVVDPNPLLSEQPYLTDSIAATRQGLALDRIRVEPYAPAGQFGAADFAAARDRLANVPAWDNYIVGARMRELASEPPYFRPGDPVVDIVPVDGRPRPTLVSAREVDLDAVPDDGGDDWVNKHLAYTHGVGLIRYSSTHTTPDRGPRLLDGGDGVPQPRLYFGVRDQQDDEAGGVEGDTGMGLLDPVLDPDMARASWSLVGTRRPEVDLPVEAGTSSAGYHYGGDGGVAIAGWARRIAYALALDSQELLLSDDITEQSRLLLHQDVHDRLSTLAPFIQWDSEAVPLTSDGHVVFVVDGYTTSTSFPGAERVVLGDVPVSYARPSVLATVDAFDGTVHLYLLDEEEPVAAAWQDAFPTLFRPSSDIPSELVGRLRYPGDLFRAQATAYEDFHVTRPDVFASRSDVWTRPVALSGPIEVAGGVDFDQDDEDDLRETLQPVYIYAPPPGTSEPRLVVSTYYVPSSGQNLVGTLNGWMDESGRAQLAARSLPRYPITLGPAQVSRLVFATPRVRNLLGLRNLEIGDLQKSSIDSVLLGQPRLIFVDSGLVQVQNLYEGSRGPGAARLIGVTAYVNGRAGLGVDLDSALRQALNEPPSVDVLAPVSGTPVGEVTEIGFRVESAQRESVTVTSSAGVERWSRTVRQGRGSVSWRPSAAGPARVHVEVTGLDGTVVSDTATIRVLAAPPVLRVLDPPVRAAVGRPVRLTFDVRRALRETVAVSTRSGIVLRRDFDLRRGPGDLVWVPTRPGPAVITLRAVGRQGQAVTRRIRLEVAPRRVDAAPSVRFVKGPRAPRVGAPLTYVFRADACVDARTRVEGPGGQVLTWLYTCPVAPGRFTWTPREPGRYVVTATARGRDSTSTATTTLTVKDRSR